MSDQAELITLTPELASNAVATVVQMYTASLADRSRLLEICKRQIDHQASLITDLNRRNVEEALKNKRLEEEHAVLVSRIENLVHMLESKERELVASRDAVQVPGPGGQVPHHGQARGDRPRDGGPLGRGVEGQEAASAVTVTFPAIDYDEE